MLSEEEKKEYFDIMDSIADEYMKKEMQKPPEERGDAENLSFVFTYKNTANLVKLSENLIKHSKTLNRWTKIMAFAALGMILLVIAQLIVLIVLKG